MFVNRNDDGHHHKAHTGLWLRNPGLRKGKPRMGMSNTGLITLLAILPSAFAGAAQAQSADGVGAAPSFGSIATPLPINPATETTNPSARATQTLNPYLGSTPDGDGIAQFV
jgi:hypothetical protein